MAEKTSIDWTDSSWNPIRGCTRISPGCERCYAERMAARFSDPGRWAHGFASMTESGPRWTGKVGLVQDKLGLPRSWRRPRKIFVNSTSDLFHGNLALEDIDQVFEAMKAAPQHTYQILTKRPQLMGAYFRSKPSRMASLSQAGIWLGVSVENEETAKKRIPPLLELPARVRFLSCEPLLESFRILGWLMEGTDPGKSKNCGKGHGFTRCPNYGGISREGSYTKCSNFERMNFAIHWVIAGGESGPGARPCRIEWLRSLKEQCERADVPLFMKQMGSRAETSYYDDFKEEWNGMGLDWPEPLDWEIQDGQPPTHSMVRIPFKNRKGADPSEWPENLRVRSFPRAGVL